MQPALVGGLVVGVLSALPVVSFGNVCCCLWVIGGGVVAAFLLQQGQPAPITAGDGALTGFLAGVIGAVIYLVLMIPITAVVAPLQREMFARIFEQLDESAAYREYMSGYAGSGLGLFISFVGQLFAGAIFGTVGGLIGVAIFRKPLSPGTIDVTPVR
jgi:hypothetical protein